MLYLDKARLYYIVDEYRKRWRLNLTSDYPLNTIDLCKMIGNIEIDYAPFITPGLRGMATKREAWDQPDMILLNAFRSQTEKNFDCGHELMHLTLHRNLGTQTFHCFDRAMPKQNTFIEWQANEGAAELLVPYRLLVPRIVAEMKLAIRMGIHVENNMHLLPECYAPQFGVTEFFMRNRIDSLTYEICQYASGTGLDELTILSKTQQERRKINLKEYPIYNMLQAI